MDFNFSRDYNPSFGYDYKKDMDKKHFSQPLIGLSMGRATKQVRKPSQRFLSI